MAKSPDTKHRYTKYDTGWNSIKAVGLQKLLANEFPQLQSLWLSKCLLNKLGIESVMRECRCCCSRGCLNWEDCMLVIGCLVLGENGISAVGMAVLTGSKMFSQIKDLNLSTFYKTQH